MLYFLVIWTVLLITSSTIGLGLLHGFRVICMTRIGDRLMMATWLGIVSLAIMMLATALFLPLSPFTGAVVASLLCAGTIMFPEPRAEVATILRSVVSRRLIGTMLVVAIAVAAFMAQEVTWLDTGLYHYGVIQWFAQYGKVPGIALLFGNYGFTSSWFALAAPLNPDILDARVTATTNGFILLIGIYQFILHLRRLLQQTGEISDWFMVIFLLLFIPFSRLEAISSIFVSPSPDAPNLILTGIIAWSIILISNSNSVVDSRSKNCSFNGLVVPLILAGGAVTMKLTAVPLLLITQLFYSYSQGFKFHRFIIGSGILALILIPLFAHSLISSGCPLYPSSLLCSNLPWSPSKEAIQTIANSTHKWTTWYDSPPDGIPHWIWAFWKWLNSSIRHWLMLLLVALSLGCMTYLLQQRVTKQRSGNYWLVAMFVIGITFFIMTTPFYRFALSYLLLLPALTLAFNLKHRFLQRSQISQSQNFNGLLKFFGKAAWIVPAILIAIFLHGKSLTQFILPPPLKQVAVVQKQVNDVKYWSPQQPNELCWSTQIPCAFSVPQNVVLRNSQLGVQGGFTRKRD